jgi:hypothetical protein
MPVDYKGCKAFKVALSEAVSGGRSGIDFGDTARICPK